MKNKNNKFLYVNDDSEEVLLPLSRLLGMEAPSSDTAINLYFDNHDTGLQGKAMLKVVATCTDAEDVVKALSNNFATRRGAFINLLTAHSKITAVEVTQGAISAVSMTMEPGSGFADATAVHKANVWQEGIFRRTQIFVDLDGLNSGDTAKDVIGQAATANCHIGQITAAVNGTIFRGTMRCLETPTNGEPNIDLVESTLATITEDTAFDASGSSATLVAADGDWAIDTAQPLTTMPTADRYLYLAAGDATNAEYNTGQYQIDLWGTI
jgi:hypothetical protein